MMCVNEKYRSLTKIKINVIYPEDCNGLSQQAKLKKTTRREEPFGTKTGIGRKSLPSFW
jgi:hypothetical protein